MDSKLIDAHNLLEQLAAQAQALLAEARKGLEPDSVENAVFLDTLQEIARQVWEAARLPGKPYRILGVTILSAILNHRENGQALSEPQLEALSSALSLLLEDKLDLEMVGQADRQLLTVGLDAIFPVKGDLASLYEATDQSATKKENST